MPRTSPVVARRARTALIALCAPVLMLTAAPVTPAAAVPGLPSAADDALKSKLGKVLSSSRVTKATVGVVVADTASGGELYKRSSATAISPASNMKLVTAAAALDLLGPIAGSARRCSRPPSPPRARSAGCTCAGYGDPTLREADLAALARQVRSGRDHPGQRSRDRRRRLLRRRPLQQLLEPARLQLLLCGPGGRTDPGTLVRPARRNDRHHLQTRLRQGKKASSGSSRPPRPAT
ncbi:MAG: D-alanyl-D-alanine carboxypeptidase [Micropruina sp.]